jgi:hypothetical protein
MTNPDKETKVLSPALAKIQGKEIHERTRERENTGKHQKGSRYSLKTHPPPAQ